MPHSIREIAAALGAEAAGDVEFIVNAVSEPASAGPDDLALAMDARYAEGLAKGQAQVALLWAGADWRALGLKGAIFSPRGRLAMAGLTRMMEYPPAIAAGVHPSCAIETDVVIGDGSGGAVLRLPGDAGRRAIAGGNRGDLDALEQFGCGRQRQPHHRRQRAPGCPRY